MAIRRPADSDLLNSRRVGVAIRRPADSDLLNSRRVGVAIRWPADSDLLNSRRVGVAIRRSGGLIRILRRKQSPKVETLSKKKKIHIPNTAVRHHLACCK